MLRRQRRVMTAQQFFDEYAGANENYEVTDGKSWMIAGGIRNRAAVAGILAALRGS